MANGHEMGDADINDGYLRKMRAMAVALDRIFNGDLMGLDRKTGFVLLVFPFDDDGEERRCNYVSNAEQVDLVEVLKDQVAKLEERLASGETV